MQLTKDFIHLTIGSIEVVHQHSIGLLPLWQLIIFCIIQQYYSFFY